MSDNVINIADLRLKKEFKNKQYCEHRCLVYDPDREVVECVDCNSYISSFKAFLMLVNRWKRASDRLKRRRANVENLEKKQFRKKAVQLIDEAWRKRKTVPVCPHCAVPIMPIDKFGEKCISKESAEKIKRLRKSQL